MKKAHTIAALLIVLGSMVVWPSIVGSCNSDTYIYNYENSRAALIGNLPTCAYTGPGCMDSGECNGSKNCATDDNFEFCIIDTNYQNTN